MIIKTCGVAQRWPYAQSVAKGMENGVAEIWFWSEPNCDGHCTVAVAIYVRSSTSQQTSSNLVIPDMLSHVAVVHQILSHYHVAQTVFGSMRGDRIGDFEDLDIAWPKAEWRMAEGEWRKRMARAEWRMPHGRARMAHSARRAALGACRMEHGRPGLNPKPINPKPVNPKPVNPKPVTLNRHARQARDACAPRATRAPRARHAPHSHHARATPARTPRASLEPRAGHARHARHARHVRHVRRARHASQGAATRSCEVLKEILRRLIRLEGVFS